MCIWWILVVREEKQFRSAQRIQSNLTSFFEIETGPKKYSRSGSGYTCLTCFIFIIVAPWKSLWKKSIMVWQSGLWPEGVSVSGALSQTIPVKTSKVKCKVSPTVLHSIRKEQKLLKVLQKCKNKKNHHFQLVNIMCFSADNMNLNGDGGKISVLCFITTKTNEHWKFVCDDWWDRARTDHHAKELLSLAL